MDTEEPGVTVLSLLRMLKRKQKIRPVVEMSTCGHCKTEYDIHKGHMCPYIKKLYEELKDNG